MSDFFFTKNPNKINVFFFFFVFFCRGEGAGCRGGWGGVGG